MPLRTLQLAELTDTLQAICTKAVQQRYLTGRIFQALYNTGLRVNEVLEVERWAPAGPDTYTVQLSKREDSRTIPASSLPAEVRAHIDQQRPYTFETYSSVNNAFKYFAPCLVVEGSKRATTCHAFRYHYIKQLHASGQTISEIAAHIGHKSEASTMRYILAAVRYTERN